MLARPLICKALLGCLPVLLAASVAVSWRPSEWLAQQLANDLQAADETQIRDCAAQLARLPESGWRVLVAAQDHPRLELREETRRTVDELFVEWRSIAPEDAGLHTTQFAKLLAERCPTASPAALAVYAGWSEQLLAWPSSRANDLERVFACEQVIRAARETGWPPEPTESTEPAASATVQSPPRSEPAVPSSRSTASLSDSTSDSTPAAIATLSNELAAEEETRVSLRISDDPKPTDPLAPTENAPRLADDSSIREPSTREPPGGVTATLPSEMPSPEEPLARVVSPLAPSVAKPPPRFAIPTEATPVPVLGPGLEPVPEAAATPAPASQPPVFWTTRPTLEVIRALSDAAHANDAERELTEARGFSPLNLQIARASQDPSAEKRVELVHALPQQPGIDSVGWLILLAQDESPRVRTAAIKLLSTGSDPRIAKHLQQLDETERDEEVRTVLRDARKRFRS